MESETQHLIEKDPEDKNAFRLTERGCAFLWLAGLLHNSGNPVQTAHPLKRLLDTIISDHKEHIDGSGILGKSGQEITLFGRLLSLAKAIDEPMADKLFRDSREVNSILRKIVRKRDKFYDPYLTDEVKRIMKEEKGELRVTGVGETTDWEKENDRIVKPPFLSPDTPTTYPTIRFIGAAFRAVGGLSQKKRQEIYHQLKVVHLLGEHLTLREEDAEHLIETLKRHGLETESEKFVEKVDGGYKLTQEGRVLGLVLPSLLQSLGGRTGRNVALEVLSRLHAKPEYKEFFKEIISDDSKATNRILAIAKTIGEKSFREDYRLPIKKEEVMEHLENEQENKNLDEELTEKALKILDDDEYFGKIIGNPQEHPFTVKVNRSEKDQLLRQRELKDMKLGWPEGIKPMPKQRLVVRPR